ncbi:MAG: hypothetical protein Hens3KO_06780 [Henriciella sp.]
MKRRSLMTAALAALCLGAPPQVSHAVAPQFGTNNQTAITTASAAQADILQTGVLTISASTPAAYTLKASETGEAAPPIPSKNWMIGFFAIVGVLFLIIWKTRSN